MSYNTPPRESEISRSSTSNSLNPDNPCSVIVERLNAFKRIVKDFLFFFELMVEFDNDNLKKYAKMSQSLPVALRDTPFFMEGGQQGIVDLSKELKSVVDRMSAYHSSRVKTIRTQTVGNFQRLRNDIKKKVKEMEQHTAEKYSRLVRQREAVKDIVRNYEETCLVAEKTPRQMPKDPWLVHVGLETEISKLINEENNFQKLVLVEQQSYSLFEASLVESIKENLSQFLEWCNHDTLDMANYIQRTTGVFRHFDTMAEWNAFSTRPDVTLANENAPQLTGDHIEYPHKDHPFTKPIKHGILVKGGKGIFKTKKEMMWVVTEAGYLHGYQNGHKIKFSAPEVTLNLSICTLGAHSLPDQPKYAFTVEEKIVNSKSRFSSSKATSYTLRAKSELEMLEWWNLLATKCHYSLKNAQTPTLPASSPPASTHGANPSPNASPLSIRSSPVGSPAAPGSPQIRRENTLTNLGDVASQHSEEASTPERRNGFHMDDSSDDEITVRKYETLRNTSDLDTQPSHRLIDHSSEDEYEPKSYLNAQVSPDKHLINDLTTTAAVN